MSGTYTEAHKKYYLKNKELIRKKTKEYRKEYSKAYYLSHRDKPKSPNMLKTVQATL